MAAPSVYAFAMTPEEFSHWRTQHGFTQDEAGKQLGVSKRSVFTYETTGPVPKAIALACKAIANEKNEIDYVQLISEQFSEIKRFFLVVPLIAERGNAYPDAVQMVLAPEVRSWLRSQKIKAKFESKIVLTPNYKRMQVPIIIFEDENQAVLFGLRWK